MIEIRHKETGARLHLVEADTLRGASLAGLLLSGADLSGLDLAGVNLLGAVCRGTVLAGADLSGANLKGAYLFEADLQGADLTDALMHVVSLDSTELSGANLTGANLTGSYLAEAKLARARLVYTNLQSTYLGGADLTGAQMAFTLLADCPSLHQAQGLAGIEHLGPSSLDLTTLRAGAARLPDAFLQGVGLAKAEIDLLRNAAAAPISSSCLLAYAAADRELGDRLRADLLAAGVNCWTYRRDLGAGYVLQIAFGQSMQRHDRLILLLSKHSLADPDLLDALQTALERERAAGERRLFPLLVDGSLPGDALLPSADQQHSSQGWRLDRARALRERDLLDFRPWKDAGSYRQAFAQLLGALSGDRP